MRLVQRFRDRSAARLKRADGHLSCCRVRSLITAAAVVAVIGVQGASDVVAQDGGLPPSQRVSETRLLEDFLHYLRIAKPDMAAASAQSLFDTGISDAELAEIVDDRGLDVRVEEVLRVSRGMEGAEDLVAQFEARLESGRKDLARDPERIRKAVEMLSGTRRQQMLAQGRLMEAGEYAVPELLRQVVESKDPSVELAASDMLIAIRRQAVTPLGEALPLLDPTSQRKVSNILGSIGWPHAGPYLLALALDESAPADVRQAAMENFRRVGGTMDNLSDQLTQLALRYFDNEQSLIAFPGEATNNLWSWDSFVGLVPQPVPTPIFGDVMAMRLTREALALNPDNAQALAIFVAANLQRENNLPAEATDPVFGDWRLSPQFFATAAGTSTATRVLSMGLERLDTPLIRDAIGALRQTAGNANLFRIEEQQPLLECLRYPDRRVQIEAALALATALPQEPFTGDFTVVPLLASAVRTGNQSFAAVVARNQEDRQVLAGRLKEMGYTVINPGARFEEITADVAAAPGVDLVVIRGSATDVRDAIRAARANASTIAAPIVAVATAVDKIDLDREYGEERRVAVWQSGTGDDAFAATVEAVVTRTSGKRLTEADAMQYAIESLDAMRAIAISGSTVYRIADAQNALIDALSTLTGGLRLLVADVMALIDTEQAQRTLMDAALTSSGTEQVDLLDRVAASARRYGNRIEQRQVGDLMDLLQTSEGATADAAARVHGALNLPPANAVQLILE